MSMTHSGPTTRRYETARTLVRRLCRLPGEDKTAYRAKVRRLREHFERFNVDVAELCQWWMTLRKKFDDPQTPERFGTLGDFLLEPSIADTEADEKTRDRWRLAIFDAVAGFSHQVHLQDAVLPDNLRKAITQATQEPRNNTTAKLFDRLAKLEKPHRLVLLKSAAEWIVARYQRGMANWLRQHEEWEKEKHEWEQQHPELTPDIRERYNAIYRQLKQPDSEPRRVNPRICTFDHMKDGNNNCFYAGQEGHGPLCWKFSQFIKLPDSQKRKYNVTWFIQHAETYLKARNRGSHPDEAMAAVDQKAQHWFPIAWREYLVAMGLSEETMLRHRRWSHCEKIGGTFENSECQYNPHTELCTQYHKLALRHLSDEDLQLEKTYREWRKRFFKSPSKPQFRYPSSDELPMPKVFGDGFHEIDLKRSILRLRLDDMPEGEWLQFGFIRWPKGYSPSRYQVAITSVHVNFIGPRARAGFRFDVEHSPSRFLCGQEQIDFLRSRVYPRQANDEAFLAEARKLLLESFRGDELRVISVDLGETGCCVSVYQGRQHLLDAPLPIIKVNELFDVDPSKSEEEKIKSKFVNREKVRRALPKKKPPPQNPEPDALGMRHKHILWHLQTLSQATEDLGKRRSKPDLPAGPRDHDLRGEKRHVRWMIRDWVRLNAQQVIAMAEKHHCDLIVFESMRGQRLPGYNQAMGEADKKRKEGMLAFGKVRRKVTEKAVERGMRTVTVPYGRSSQVCSACGRWQCDNAADEKRWKNDKRNKRFLCKHKDCALHLDPSTYGERIKEEKDKRKSAAIKAEQRNSIQQKALDSDINGARVLARVFWGEITLPTPEEVKAAEPAKNLKKPPQ